MASKKCGIYHAVWISDNSMISAEMFKEILCDFKFKYYPICSKIQ